MVEVASKLWGKMVTGCRAGGGHSGPVASTALSWDLLLLPRNPSPLWIPDQWAHSVRPRCVLFGQMQGACSPLHQSCLSSEDQPQT